ncbi:MAG: hypothetical protein ACXAB2_09590 [Candidatus Hodarchaeales archaeon]
MNTTITHFSWRRLEGIGLILTSIGVALLSQLPSTFFAFILLHFDFESNFISMIGILLGTTLILTAVSCSFTEDYYPTVSPTLKSVLNSSFLFSSLFIVGFFVFFILQPNLPPDMRILNPDQRYLIANFSGLTLIALFTVLFYKGRAYFTK